MSDFRFRLKTLLRMRESGRDERRGRLAEAYVAEQKLLEKHAELQAELDELKGYGRVSGQVGTVELERLLAAHRFGLVVQLEMQTVARQQKLLAEEIEKRRQALVIADREVRVLETLRDKQRERHQLAEAAQAMKLIDELAGRQWWEAEH